MAKQRTIGVSDLATLDGVPDEVKATALWLWLNLDPLGRGFANPRVLARRMRTDESIDTLADRLEEHLLVLMEAGWLTTYMAEGEEWILLLYPLKVDLRDTRITTPEPPAGLVRPPMGHPLAVGRGRASECGRADAGAWARGTARAAAEDEVRAEDAARAAAWDAVQEDREEAPERPERPIVLDAPQMFCDEHMPGGPREKKCGPCRDFRLLREEWMARRVYTERLAAFRAIVPKLPTPPEGVWDDEPF